MKKFLFLWWAHITSEQSSTPSLFRRQLSDYKNIIFPTWDFTRNVNLSLGRPRLSTFQRSFGNVKPYEQNSSSNKGSLFFLREMWKSTWCIVHSWRTPFCPLKVVFFPGKPYSKIQLQVVVGTTSHKSTYITEGCFLLYQSTHDAKTHCMSHTLTASQ